jgi:hypothetical protein
VKSQRTIELLFVLSLALNLFLSGIFVSKELYKIENDVEVSSDLNPVIRPNVTKEVYKYNRTVKKGFQNSIQGYNGGYEYDVGRDGLTVNSVDRCVELTGGSMRPTIFSGNTVCFEKYTSQELEEGMIVRNRNGDGYRAHRIWGTYEDDGYVVTQGDNNRNVDGKVNISNITHISVGVLYT